MAERKSSSRLASSLVLDLQKRNRLGVPENTRRRRGLECSEAIRPSTRSTRRRVMMLMFSSLIASGISDYGLLDGLARGNDDIRAEIAELMEADLLPQMSSEELERAVFWVQRLNERPFDDIVGRQQALNDGCIIDENIDPLFQIYEERGSSPEFLRQYADRLMAITEFLGENAATRSYVRQIRRAQGDPSQMPDERELRRIIREDFPYSALRNEQTRALPEEVLFPLMQRMSQRIANNRGRSAVDLVWTSIQRFHLQAQQKRQLIQDRPEFFRVSTPSIGTSPEHESSARFQKETIMFLPYGSVPKPDKERHVAQQGQADLKAYLLVMAERLGDHIVMELPQGIPAMIIDESRRLRSQVHDDVPLFERLAHHIIRSQERVNGVEGRLRNDPLRQSEPERWQRRWDSLQNRRERLIRFSQAMYGCLPGQLEGRETLPCPFSIRAHSRQPSETEVYLRLLGLYYLEIIRQSDPEVFRLNGEQLDDEDFMKAFEVSVRLETERRAHVQHRQGLRVNLRDNSRGRSNGRLSMILGRAHAEIPRLVLFNDLTTLLGLNLAEILQRIIPPEIVVCPPGPGSVGGGTASSGEDDPSAEDHGSAGTGETEEGEDAQTDDGEDSQTNEGEDSIPRMSPEQRENLLKYRTIYAGHLMQQIALTQHLQSFPEGIDPFPLKRAIHVSLREGVNPPNPFEDATEWFEARNIPVPGWQAINQNLEAFSEGSDYTDMMVDTETSAENINTVFAGMADGAVFDLCFPIAPPSSSMMTELGHMADIEIIKENGASIDQVVHHMISSQGCTDRFMRDFRSYMCASVEGVTIIRLRKKSKASKHTLTQVDCDMSQLCLRDQEISFGLSLCEYFDLMQDVTAWLPARIHLARSIVHRAALGDLDFSSTSSNELFQQALELLEQDAGQDSYDIINELLTSICSNEEDGGRCMERHLAFEYSLRVLNIYLRCDEPSPPELLALHPNQQVRERFLAWLETRRQVDPGYVNRVLLNLMERINYDLPDEEGFFDEAYQAMGGPELGGDPLTRRGSSLQSWEERQEVLINDEQKLLWLEEGLQSGDMIRQRRAIDLIPALQFTEPGAYVSVLNRCVAVIFRELLPGIGDQVRSDGYITLLSPELFTSIASYDRGQWKTFEWSQLGDSSTETIHSQRRIWCHIGTGSHARSRNWADEDSRSQVLSNLQSDSSVSRLVITEALNTIDFYTEEENFSLATDLILSNTQGPNQLLLALRDSAFRQLSILEGGKAKRLSSQLLELLDRGESPNEGAYGYLDRAMGGSNTCSQYFLGDACRYLGKVETKGSINADSLLATAQELVDPAPNESSVRQARSGAIFLTAQWLRDELRAEKGRDATVLEYLTIKVINGTDETPQVLRRVLENPKQRSFFASILETRTAAPGMILEIPITSAEISKKPEAAEGENVPEETEQILVDDLLNDPRLSDPAHADEQLELLDDRVETIGIFTFGELNKRALSFQALQSQLTEHLSVYAARCELVAERYLSIPVEQHDQVSVRITNSREDQSVVMTIREALECDPLSKAQELWKDHDNITVHIQEEHLTITLHDEPALWDLSRQKMKILSEMKFFVMVIIGPDGQVIPGGKALLALREKTFENKKKSIWVDAGLDEVRSFVEQGPYSLHVGKGKERGKFLRTVPNWQRKAYRETYVDGDTLRLRFSNNKTLVETTDREMTRGVVQDLQQALSSSIDEKGRPEAQVDGTPYSLTFDATHQCWVITMTAEELAIYISEKQSLTPSEGLQHPIHFLGTSETGKNMAIPMDPFDPTYQRSLKGFLKRNGQYLVDNEEIAEMVEGLDVATEEGQSFLGRIRNFFTAKPSNDEK
jgi:hypothetical protein